MSNMEKGLEPYRDQKGQWNCKGQSTQHKCQPKHSTGFTKSARNKAGNITSIILTYITDVFIIPDKLPSTPLNVLIVLRAYATTSSASIFLSLQIHIIPSDNGPLHMRLTQSGAIEEHIPQTSKFYSNNLSSDRAYCFCEHPMELPSPFRPPSV